MTAQKIKKNEILIENYMFISITDHRIFANCLDFRAIRAKRKCTKEKNWLGMEHIE